ncbi:glycosyltransferase [Aquabacterium sp.]|uniref:glycosyltransferase n=1 Tax=Aquabacterium sp. TaxID=1872578 RepID=UPI0025C1B128|nr:glycosyltransferase [Aquabacterium sp.]
MRLSIITINRNDAKGLARTLNSILPVLANDVECVVVDGLSSDDSVAVAQRLTAGMNNVVIKSESDSGIYDAMNKGARLARGKYLAYVNAGDEVVPEAYRRYLEFMRAHSADVFYSKTYLRSLEGVNMGVHERHPTQMNQDTIPHLTAAVRRQLFLEQGGFDQQYKISADREFFIRLKLSNASFLFFDDVVAIFELGGLSSSPRTKVENLRIDRKYGFISSFKYFRRLLKMRLAGQVQS